MTVRLPSSTYPNDETGRKTWVRAVYDALGGLVSGKQDKSDNLTSIAGLTLTGNSGDAIVVKATEDGFELAAGAGGGGTTTNALTITNTGGAAAGATFNGSAAVTIDYSTVGAAASGHDHDSDYLQLTGGTLTGDLSVPDEAYDATNWNGSLEVPTKNAVRDKIESMSSPAMVLISEQSPSGTGTVTFSSIAATYRDLRIVVRGRGTNASANVQVLLRFNNDSTAIYDRIDYEVDPTPVVGELLASTSITLGYIPAASATANVADVVQSLVSNYRDTTFQKAVISNSGLKMNTTSGNLLTVMSAGWWRSTAAIDRVDIILSAGNFVTGSVVSLYGIM